jgi:hypothetical protein
MEVVTFDLDAPFDGGTAVFNLTPAEPELGNGNSLVFLGGVLQDPSGPPVQVDPAYMITSSIGGSPNLSFIGAAPLAGTTVDVRGILSGALYRSSGIPVVYMSSTDEISPDFDGARTVFPLTISGDPIDATKVNAENMFVNVGGVIQIPIENSAAVDISLSYSVSVNPVTQQMEITFASPPLPGTTCNIRILTQDEFITCPLPDLLTSGGVLRVGPGVEAGPDGSLEGLDEGLIG